MSKKGFTLVELVAVIVILGLVLTIAMTSISGFIDRFHEKQNDNIIKGIEDAASKYAFDKGKTIMFVQDLIDEGYLDADDDGNVLNTETKERLNCYVVEAEKVGTYYTAKYKSNTKYEKSDGTCDKSKIVSSDNINITVNGGTSINGWLKGNNISLKVSASEISIDCNTNKCLWTSSSGIKEEGKDNIDIPNASLSKIKYTFQYSINGTDSIKRYTKSIEVKIDNENPVIYNDEIIVENRNGEGAKIVEIVASDGNGSGISGYAITTGNCSSVSYSVSNRIEVSGKGTYKICVKDNVGNVKETSYTI